MKLKSGILPWICVLAGTSSSIASASDLLMDYRQGNYVKAAVSSLSNQVKDPVVDYYMGRMYLYGYGELRNTTAAISHFKDAAQKGYSPAQHFMAAYSLVKENNPEQALYWYKKAATNPDDTKAQMYCAAAYLFGVGTKKNQDLARNYYIAAAKSGNSIAEAKLAENFLDSRQDSNKKLGLLWLNKAVAHNNPAALLRLGKMYNEGNSVPKDEEKANQLISASVASGYLPALFYKGELAMKKNDIQQAKDWYTKAAISHYIPAEMALSRLYTQDKSPLFNLNMGFVWMMKAAQNGSSEAQLAVAEMYKAGKGTDINENLAKEWQQKAALSAKDNPVASEEAAASWLTNGKFSTLASSGYKLKGILTDWSNKDALKENTYNQAPRMDVITRDSLYKPKFEMTNPNQIPISEFYNALATSLSNSTTQNSPSSFPRYPLAQNAGSMNNDEFLKHLQQRAILGDYTAQFTLGQMYDEGSGVTKNIQEAIKQYQLATEQQDLRAEYNLGMLYLEGKGETADYDKAINLLKDAAFKGNDYAQYSLARIAELGYLDAAGGVVIKPDHELAIVMYDLAAANDNGLAQYRLAEMLAREKKEELTVAAIQQREKMLKSLYQGAFKSGVTEAAVPLAFFNAMDTNKDKNIKAFEVAKKEADAGNLAAALLLGIMYDRGIGVDINQKDAIYWYEQAPANPVTAFILGTYYSQGIGVSKDETKGKELLQTAANGEFSYANLNLAVIKQQSGETFLTELDKALDLGNSKAGLLLADYYLSTGNDDKKMNQARDIYNHFAERGDKDAELKLGYMFEKGLGGEVSLADAEKWYTEAATQGQAEAQYLLGNLYQLGLIENKPDYILAKKWYSFAQSSYAPAAVALGFIYDTVDDDYKQALLSYNIAANLNDPIGKFDLGLVYEKGKGQPVDFAKAKDQYLEAAKNGLSPAMVQLAGIYFNGLDGTTDQEQALYWYKKAADLGNKDALYQLGLLSETGVATKLDFSDAMKYYQESADLGDAKAKLALARIYQFGLGTVKNIAKAKDYYKELAESGNAYAQYQLAIFAFEGVDGKKMPEEGKKLLKLADQNGSKQASRTLQWLDAQSQVRTSFIEPSPISSQVLTQKPADLMYMDALNEWNLGDERSSRLILSKLLTQFPDYIPAKKAYEQLNQQLTASDILG